MKEYMPRIADKILKQKLEYMGGVLIEGCKCCGKSTTAKQVAKSYIEFQDPDRKIQYDKISTTKPSIFLEGEKSRLFDEWQMYPVVWDSIRTDVDRTGLKGQYILTCSARPAEKYGEPSFLMVLTADEYSYKREDGIYVVSIDSLKD